MVSHPETGSDSPIGSDRGRGRDRHIIFSRGIEVDKAKIELISKLPSPTNVKTVRQFLGHAGFYRRFIKDFSKIAKTLYKLLEKDAKFFWEKEC